MVTKKVTEYVLSVDGDDVMRHPSRLGMIAWARKLRIDFPASLVVVIEQTTTVNQGLAWGR
jgi:hypothetical protein